MEDAALFFHILGVLVFVSGAVVAGVASEVARRRREPSEIVLLLGLARLGAVLLGLGMLLVLVFGLALLPLGHWSFRAGWIDAAIALFVLAAVLGGVGGQRPKEARQLAARLAAAGLDGTKELRDLIEDRRSRRLNYVSATLVLAILALMVFKPGAGIR